MGILSQIERYRPWNGQERSDKAVMLGLLASQPDIFSRENPAAHMTASAWIVNQSRDRVLMVYHNLYRSWSWTGGHADGGRDLSAVALREAKEETGLTDLTLVSEEIFSLEILTVCGHEKGGVYVPSHLHLNVTWLAEADESGALRIKPDENSGVAWLSPDQAVELCTEPWMAERIYNKLIAKTAWK